MDRIYPGLYEKRVFLPAASVRPLPVEVAPPFGEKDERRQFDLSVVAGEGQWSEAFDTAEDPKHLPPGYTGGIWTERIDRIAPLFIDKKVNAKE